MGGISGVENLHFGKDCRNVNIRGTSEFYNLYNDTGRTEETWVVWLKIEGYSEKKAPVFHKAFDWGTGEFDGENGEHWTNEYGIGIQYMGDFEKWEALDIGQNKVAAKFDMSDVDILGMTERFDVAVPGKDYLLDMDGKTIDNESEGFGIERFRDCEGMTAAEVFDAFGKREWPEEGREGIAGASSVEQAVRYIAAYQKKNNAEGYYTIHIPRGAVITEALTVPEGVQAIMYEGPNDYDEGTNTDTLLPVSISSINVPAGKKVSLFRTLVNTGNITISGEGTTELVDARFNANVKADKVQIVSASVKSLNCREMTITQNSRLVVSEYLNFKKAEIDAEDSVIYGQPGAYLSMGEISVPESDSTDSPNIFIGVNGKNRAQVYFGSNINTGKFTYDGREYTRNILLRLFDEKEALSDGALCAKDCFDATYNYDGYDNDTDNWWNYSWQYNGEELCLFTIGSTADADNVLENLATIFKLKAEDGEVRYCEVAPRYLHLDEFKNLTDGIDGNKRLAFYMDWWSNEEEIKAVDIPAYYEVSGESLNSIASAQISTIKTQLYTGEAIKPSVTVTLNGKKLKAGTDYTVSYANNTKAGSTASVIITGKGNYVGTAIQNFEIAAIPAKGKVYTSGNLKYKVTKSAYKNGTVSVYAPTKKTLTRISVPATVKINGYIFNVTAIGDKAFNGCTKLKKVTIGSKVTTIGKQAFNGCKALTSITVNSKVLKTVGASALKGISAKAVIKVPAAKLSAYQKLLKGKGQKSSVKITK